MEFNRAGILFLFAFCINFVKSKDTHIDRNKRALLFPESSTLGIFIAIAVPIDLVNRNVFMSYNFEANYNLPFEGKEFIPGPLERFTEFEDEGRQYDNSSSANEESKKRRRRSEKRRVTYSNLLTRKLFYNILEEKFKSTGYIGRPCLLRLICETNASNIGKNNGVVGDIFSILLSPITSMAEELDGEFYLAEQNGLNFNCDMYKKQCLYSILDKLTVLR